MKRTFLASALVLGSLTSLGLGGCGGRPDIWDSRPSPAKTQVVGLENGVALIDDAAHRAVILLPKADQDLDRVAFSELGSDFRVSAGKIASDNVFLRETSEKLRNIGLKGTTTVRGELDYGVDLAALRETIGDRGIRDVLRGVEAVLGKEGFPIRLGGTLKEPRLTWGATPEEKGGKGAGGLGLGARTEPVAQPGRQDRCSHVFRLRLRHLRTAVLMPSRVAAAKRLYGRNATPATRLDEPSQVVAVLSY